MLKPYAVRVHVCTSHCLLKPSGVKNDLSLARALTNSSFHPLLGEVLGKRVVRGWLVRCNDVKTGMTFILSAALLPTNNLKTWLAFPC